MSDDLDSEEAAVLWRRSNPIPGVVVPDICHKEDCYGQLDGCEYKGHRLNLVEQNRKAYQREIYGGCHKCRHSMCRDGDICGLVRSGGVERPQTPGDTEI